MSASGKRLLAACILALCSIPVLIVYTWVFTPDLIPHEGIWYCEELDATWDLNTSSGTIQVNGKQEAFVSLHQFYCNLFYLCYYVIINNAKMFCRLFIVQSYHIIL